MKKLIFIMLLGSISTTYAQNWSASSNYPCTDGSDGGVVFAIGNKIYAGGGFVSKCFYEYDPLTDKWTQKTDLPVASCKAFGIAFSVNGKGYAGLGFDMNGSVVDCKSDLWEYDPATDKWTQKTNYPGKGCDALFAFTIGDKAYIGGGELPLTSNSFGDAYMYDAVLDTWTQIADYPDSPGVISPFSFTINNKGFVSCGTVGSGEVTTTYEYNPVLNQWTRKADFAGNARQGGVAFVLDNKAYCGWGDDYVTHKEDFYAYDAATDSWQYAFDGPGDARTFATAVNAGNSAYLGLGWSDQVDNYYDWNKYIVTNSILRNGTRSEFQVSPNPTSGILNINSKEELVYSVSDMTGKILVSGTVKNACIDISALPASVYILTLSENGNRESLIITRQ